MNTSHENHDPTNADNLHDQLLDVALAELVGGATPPDLSARIAAATSRQPAAPAASTQAPRTRQDRAFWARLAVAAMLLVSVTVVLFANGRLGNKQHGTVVDLAAQLQNHHPSLNSLPTVSTASNGNAPSTNSTSDATKASKIVDLVEEFNRLNHEQRYAESEVAARRLVELAPEDPVAKQVWANAKFIRREMMNQQLTDNKESSTWEQVKAVEESAINPAPSAANSLASKATTRNVTGSTTPNSTAVPVAQTAARPQGVGIYPEDGLSANSLALDASGPARSYPGGPSTYNFATDPSLRYTGETYAAGPGGVGGRSDNGRSFHKLNTSIASTANAPQSQPEPADRYGSTDLGTSAGKTVAGQPSQTITWFNQRGAKGEIIAATIDDVADLQKTEHELVYDQKRWKDSPRDLEAIRERLRPSGDRYNPIVENQFIKAEGGDAVSTFSIDVDTASYANIRQFLLQMNQLPPADAVRIEELVNYFHYDYAPPKAADEAPFAAHVEVTACPWSPEHRLARIGIKGREMDRTKRPQSNLVFLVDVSGSMNEPAKLPLVVYGLQELTRELGENDHIAIVVYAGTEGVVLPSTSGSKQDTILAALGKLSAGGSTAGGAGIQLAYQIAEDNFIKGGTNRVILCTDGDFNVGVTDTAELQAMVAKKAKETGVFISTLGFGRGNLNDAMMVAISDHGNGNYHYIDSRSEARRVLVEEMTGTLVTIAKDVKIQVEFNPAQVASYRLIGYEKRMLKTEDFNNDKKDAGEIGAGHTVTALYEIVPAGAKAEAASVDDLKYQKPAAPLTNEGRLLAKLPAPSNELLTLKMRYKVPDGDTSKKLEWPITDAGKSFAAASADSKFAAAIAGFGLLLRDSQYKGNLTYAAVEEIAQSNTGEDPHGYRKEFLDMVRKAKELRHE